MFMKEGTDKFSLLGWMLDSVSVVSIQAACPLYPLCKESTYPLLSANTPSLCFILPLTYFFCAPRNELEAWKKPQEDRFRGHLKNSELRNNIPHSWGEGRNPHLCWSTGWVWVLPSPSLATRGQRGSAEQSQVPVRQDNPGCCESRH